MFHRTNHCLGCVGYVYVGRIYQNRGETLLGSGRVCFGDFKYQHWLLEIAYRAFKSMAKVINLKFIHTIKNILF